MCQPVDVGIGKPLKTRARHLWEEWMISEISNNPNGPCCHASREQMSQWIHTAFKEIKLSNRMIAYKSWRHHQFTYFPNEPARDAVPPTPIAAAPPNEPAHDTVAPPPIVTAAAAQAVPLAASLPPEQRQDPGWDDTDDSDFEPADMPE